MFHLSETGKVAAKCNVLSALSDRANRILPDKGCNKEEGIKSIWALAAVDRTPDIARAVGWGN